MVGWRVPTWLAGTNYGTLLKPSPFFEIALGPRLLRAVAGTGPRVAGAHLIVVSSCTKLYSPDALREKRTPFIETDALCGKRMPFIEKEAFMLTSTNHSGGLKGPASGPNSTAKPLGELRGVHGERLSGMTHRG